MKKYQIIYADPPWHFRNWADNTASRWVGDQYPVLNKQDVYNLPVSQIADKNCLLFLWVTAPCLLEGIETIKAWGFEYKTKAFCWVKRNKKANSLFWGMGYWTRSNVEDCLLGVKGKPKRRSASVHQIIETHWEKHSKKPDSVREKIVELVGDLPRIELFAREKTPGWTAVGYDIDGRNLEESLKLLAQQK